MKVNVFKGEFDVYSMPSVMAEFIKRKAKDEAVFVLDGLIYEYLPAYPKEVYVVDDYVFDIYLRKVESAEKFFEAYKPRNSREVIVFGDAVVTQFEKLGTVGGVYQLTGDSVLFSKIEGNKK